MGNRPIGGLRPVKGQTTLANLLNQTDDRPEIPVGPGPRRV